MGAYNTLPSMPGELTPGYDALSTELPQEDPPESFSFAPNPDYERYLLINKVFVGHGGAATLETIHSSLSQEFMPRYLSAAGWAAAEAALVQTSQPINRRLALLDSAVDSWRGALINQRILNETGKKHLAEYSAPYRSALDIAVAPLIQGMILGDVTDKTCRSVFEDTLKIAHANIDQLKLASEQRNVDAIGEHIGFGYECNALLAFNGRLSSTWFALPSMHRSDSGHHNREQTHDLIIIHQKWGDIASVTPVEIKAKASLPDRIRYKALLVRGKMHLSAVGKYTPQDTLEALTVAYQGTAGRDGHEVATKVSDKLVAMIRDYYAGEKLGNLATGRSVTTFRDNAVVISRHPGLAKTAIVNQAA